MSIQKITNEEIAAASVAALSSRPSSPSLYGGRPLSASELKEAFDRLPKLIAARLNALLECDGLYADGKSSLSECIATGLAAGHSLKDLFDDIGNGNLLEEITDGENSLGTLLSLIQSKMSLLENGEIYRFVKTSGEDYAATYRLEFNENAGVPGAAASWRAVPNSAPLQVSTDVKDLLLPQISEIRATANTARQIAAGRATGYVFDTEEEMQGALEDEDFTEGLQLGDNLYIRDVDVPDYWWDGEEAQRLETQKTDLSEYLQRSALTLTENADGSFDLEIDTGAAAGGEET